MTVDLCVLQNGHAMSLAHLPTLPFAEFRSRIIEAVAQGGRISSMFGRPCGDDATGTKLQLVAVLAADARATLIAVATVVDGRYPALTPDCPQAHMFEREIAEQWAVVPEGHPWPRSTRGQPPCRAGGPATGATEALTDAVRLPGGADLFRVEGDEVHEVAVGPVHAGVIEPGHFRFQCHGEKVFHLEISLGYQHRGIERALLGGPHKRTLAHIETIAGDTTIGHTTAYCQAVEALSGCDVPPRAQALRALALELERLANHTGDLGALAGDVGFLPTSSFCGRIRGDFLNMTALVCGNRLGRGWVRPGGVGFDLESKDRLDALTEALRKAKDDTRVAIELLFDTPAAMARFEDTGTVTRKAVLDLGLVGPAARACGLDVDVRRDFPMGHYRRVKPQPIGEPERRNGDVAARAFVRWAEIRNSIRFIEELLPVIPPGELIAPHGLRLAADAFVVSLVEGWRGEICHTVMTDAQGRFARYKIVDPSFHNWIGLGMALRNQEISDFPLCNKSFNLSYCGFDL